MVALILLGILLVVVGWLVFWPWVLEIDTSRNTYQLYQKGTIRLWLTTGFQLHMRIIGISVPLKGDKKDHTATELAEPKKKRPFRIHRVLSLFKGIINSIKVNWFYLDLDTDDVVLNAQLIPVFYWMSRGPIHLTTNFEGRVSSRLRVELKLYRMGWAFLLFFIKKQTVWK